MLALDQTLRDQFKFFFLSDCRDHCCDAKRTWCWGEGYGSAAGTSLWVWHLPTTSTKRGGRNHCFSIRNGTEQLTHPQVPIIWLQQLPTFYQSHFIYLSFLKLEYLRKSQTSFCWWWFGFSYSDLGMPKAQ